MCKDCYSVICKIKANQKSHYPAVLGSESTWHFCTLDSFDV